MKTYWQIAILIIGVLTSYSAFATGGKPAEEPEEVSAADAAFEQANCIEKLCIGDEALVAHSDYYVSLVTIETITSDGRFLIRWANGNVGPTGGFHRDALALTAKSRFGKNACNGELCIGSSAILAHRDYYVNDVTIVGLRTDGNFMIKYANGNLGPASGFGSDNLALVQALTGDYYCGSTHCVGDTVILNHRDYSISEVTIAGVLPSDRYIIRWDNGNLARAEGFYGSNLAAKRKRQRTQEELDREEVKTRASDPTFDMESYHSLRKSGLSHREAMDRASGPVWTSQANTKNFLSKLSGHVYQFDKLYLLEITKLLESGDNMERRQLFIGAAMLPYLKNFGYKAVKERYLTPSIQAIETQLASRGVKTLADIESTSLMRRLAVYLLAASLQTAMPQLNETQKVQATEILRVLADSATKGMRYRDMQALYAFIPTYRALLLELTHNLYLQARVAADMQLLDYLENS